MTRRTDARAYVRDDHSSRPEWTAARIAADHDQVAEQVENRAGGTRPRSLALAEAAALRSMARLLRGEGTERDQARAGELAIYARRQAREYTDVADVFRSEPDEYSWWMYLAKGEELAAKLLSEIADHALSMC